MNINTTQIDPEMIQPLEIDLNCKTIYLVCIHSESSVPIFKEVLTPFLDYFEHNSEVGLAIYLSPSIDQSQILNYLTNTLEACPLPEVLVLNEALNSQEKLELLMSCHVYFHLEKELSHHLIEALALNKTVLSLQSEAINDLKQRQVLHSFNLSDDSLTALFIANNQNKLTQPHARQYVIQTFDLDRQTLDQIERTQLIALYAWGASGSNFVQTLFDSHPEILMFPINSLMNFHTVLWPEFYQLTQKSGFRLEYLVSACAQRLEPLFDGRRHPTQHQFDKLGPERKSFLQVDINRFKETLNDYLQLYTQYQLDITRKVFFTMIHYAYAKAQGQDLTQKKVIFHHLHIPENYRDMKMTFEDFPTMKTLVTQRHPMASMFSNLKRATQVFSEDQTFESLVSNGEFNKYYRHQLIGTQNISKQSPTPTYFLKIEELHNNPEQIMKELSFWLELQWDNHLLESTINGLKYWGSNLSAKPFSGFSKNHHQSKKWKQVFSLLDSYTFAFLFNHQSSNYYFKRTPVHKLIGHLMVFKPTKLELKALWQATLKKDTESIKKIILNVLRRYLWSYEYLFGEEVHALYKMKSYEYLEELMDKQNK